MQTYVSILIAVFLWAPAFAADVSCYSLYDQTGKLISQDQRPPFDISLPKQSDYAASEQRGEQLIIDTRSFQNCFLVVDGKGGPEPVYRELGATPNLSRSTASVRMLQDSSTSAGFSNYGGTYSAGSYGSTYSHGAKDVFVHDYYRRDGTHVSSHYRSAPRRR